MASISEARRLSRDRRHRRIRKKLSGTPEIPRLAVRRTAKHIYAQLIDDLGHRSIAATSTLDPQIRGELGGKSKTERSKLVGKRIAEIAKEKGIEKVAWLRDNCGGTTRDVATKLPNPFGLYDMCGNVWEWCRSRYKSYPYRSDDGREDLKAPGNRVLRGAAMNEIAPYCRSAARLSCDPASADRSFGFRIVMVLPQKP